MNFAHKLIKLSVILFVTLVDGSDYCPRIALANGNVRYAGRRQNRLARFSCKWGFELIGDKYAVCKFGTWDLRKPYCIKGGCKPFPDLTNGMQFYTRNRASVMFFCNPDYHIVGSAFAFCNGVKWNATQPSCSYTKNDTVVTSCNFETPDLCGWTNDQFHDFDWTRKNLNTPSGFVGTGPSYDHTLGAGKLGYYVYIESSSRSLNDTARLISSLYPGSLSKNGCFVFYYHMYGRTTGMLRVYVKPENVEFNKIIDDSSLLQKYKMFEKSGNQGNFWFRGFFELDEMNTNFQIIMEGVRGHGYVSDIAIDDVAILQSEQCIEFKNNASTAAVPINTVRDSCVNRCDKTVSRTDSGETVDCQCNADCYDSNTCCLDYRDLCIFSDTTTDAYVDSTLDADLTTADSLTGPPMLPTPLKTSATKTPEVEIASSTNKQITTPKIVYIPTVERISSRQPRYTTKSETRAVPIATQAVAKVTTTSTTTKKAIRASTVKTTPSSTTPKSTTVQTTTTKYNQTTKASTTKLAPIYFTNENIYDIDKAKVEEKSSKATNITTNSVMKNTTKVQKTEKMIIENKPEEDKKKIKKFGQDGYVAPHNNFDSQGLSTTAIVLIILAVSSILSIAILLRSSSVRDYSSNVVNRLSNIRHRWRRTGSLSQNQADMRFLVQDEELENCID